MTDMTIDQAVEYANVLDVVSRRTRVSYRDIRQSTEELQSVLQALVDNDMHTDEDALLLDALRRHPDVQNYTLPTETDRRNACVVISNFVDACERDRRAV